MNRPAAATPYTAAGEWTCGLGSVRAVRIVAQFLAASSSPAENM